MAFYSNKNLTCIKFDGNIQSIGYDAFSELADLKEFYYPKLVNGNYPFCYLVILMLMYIFQKTYLL